MFGSDLIKYVFNISNTLNDKSFQVLEILEALSKITIKQILKNTSDVFLNF